MFDFAIVTDSMTDLPENILTENEIEVMHLSYTIDGEHYEKGQQLDAKEFYARMRNGSMPITSQVNPEYAKEVFQRAGQKNKNILCISFSSGLSGTYNSALVAANELMEEDPQYQISVVDSLAASLGQGLMVYQAIQQRKEGKTKEEIMAFIKENIDHYAHVVTVDDLFHLYRGGRVSRTSAVVGSLIQIKPMIILNNEGKLIPVEKARGRKKSLAKLVDMMGDRLENYKGTNDVICIGHGDCLEEALYVKSLIEQRFGFKEFIINEIGPTIGAHTGPNVVVIFFMGEYK